MTVDDESMHEHFFYVMDNFEKLAEKVEELENNLTVVLMVQAKMIEEMEEMKNA